MPSTQRCPVCEKQFAVADVPANALPFCSLRCRQIDLGRWLRESYGLPIERAEGDEEREDSPGE